MPDFYPIPEAAKHTGKSVTTIRRFVRSIAANDQHPDRGHLLPSPADVRKIKAAGEQFAWTVSVELLDREFDSSKSSPWASARASDPLTEVVSLLRMQLQDNREQLKVKDQQIASQAETIQSLNERIHEGNVLMATVQKQLALTEPVKLKEAPPTKPAKIVEKQSTPKRPTRKGFLTRLFR